MSYLIRKRSALSLIKEAPSPSSGFILSVTVDNNNWKAITEIDLTINGLAYTISGITGNGTWDIPNVETFQLNSWPSNFADNTQYVLFNGGEITIDTTYALIKDSIIFYHGASCFAAGTLITLADFSQKPIEDLSYNDNLLCFDFKTSQFKSAKPLWLQRRLRSDHYFKIAFADGSVLNAVGPQKSHRLYNATKRSFIYPQDWSQHDRAFNSKGETVEIVSIKRINNPVDYYNLEIGYYLNEFAEGILAGSRFSNVTLEKKSLPDNLRSDFEEIPDKYWDGLRLAEQHLDEGNQINFCKTMKEHIIHHYIEVEK